MVSGPLTDGCYGHGPSRIAANRPCSSSVQNARTSYQVDASSIGASGRSVRCSRCRTVWVAARPADVPALHASEPVAQAAGEAVDAFRAELGAAAGA